MSFMLGKAEIVAALIKKVESRETTQKAIAEALGVAPARISELFKGARDLSADEAKLLVEAFGLEDGRSTPHPPTLNDEALRAIVSGLVEAAETYGPSKEQSLPVLADALGRILERLGEKPAIQGNPDAIREAVFVAAARPRDSKH
ncbi:helix-turn-helix transcriptional regulator [Pedomonas sp. V897]|uniref:helix-turn-helix transcriptional regulator n=1 Tax=Pedomonas sp. V897 TaxID=3446482 RepID=UPI003EDF8E2B